MKYSDPKKNFTFIPHQLCASVASGESIRLWSYLASKSATLSWDGKSSYPSPENIIEDLNISENTLLSSIKELVELKMLTVFSPKEISPEVRFHIEMPNNWNIKKNVAYN